MWNGFWVWFGYSTVAHGIEFIEKRNSGCGGIFECDKRVGFIWKQKLNAMAKMKNWVWLLMGLTGSTEGVLSLKDNHISFKASGKGALTSSQLKSLAARCGKEDLVTNLGEGTATESFHCPISQINKIVFPWYTFGGGMNLVINGVTYRFSFLQPQNTVTSFEGVTGLNVITTITQGRKVGKAWKQLLTS